MGGLVLLDCNEYVHLVSSKLRTPYAVYIPNSISTSIYSQIGKENFDA